MQRNCFGFLFKCPQQTLGKMIPAVVLAFALATSTLALPLTTQEQLTSGAENVPQLQEAQVYQNVEKTGVQGFSETYFTTQQQNTPATKAENLPVSVEQPQATHPANPVLLPIQPLSDGQVGQVVRPIIIPAEAITDGRVVITATQPIQQRNFQQVETIITEQPQTYTPAQAGVEPPQPYNVQPFEKLTPGQQEITRGHYIQGQQPLVQVQTVPVNQVEQQTVPVVNYNPVPVEPSVQVYNLPQSVQPFVAESPEKHHFPTHYSPVQTPFVESSAQQAEEKQGSRFAPVQYQQEQSVNHVAHQSEGYAGQPIVVENIEKQVQTQQLSQFQQQLPDQQPFEKQAEYQQFNTYTSVGNQPLQQGVYNVESVVEKQKQFQPAHTLAQTQSAESQLQQLQQPVEKQAYYQQPVQFQQQVPVQTYSAEPTQQQVYSVQSEQVPQQQAHIGKLAEQVPQQKIYSGQPAEQIPQQQIYNVQPAEQVLQQQVYSIQSAEQVPQVIHPQSANYASEQISKTSAVEPQVYNVQVPEAVSYTGEPIYNAGENLPLQNTQVQTLSVVPQTQTYSAQPLVVSTQE